MKQNNRSWKLLQEAGLEPSIKSLEQYEQRVQLNINKLKTELSDRQTQLPLDTEDIKFIHKKMFAGVMKNAGEYSKRQMSFGGFIGSPAQNVDKEFKALDVRLKKMWGAATSIDSKVRILAIQHASIVAIHGFSDGNGRVSRFLFERSERLLLKEEKIEANKLLKSEGRQSYIDSMEVALRVGQVGFLAKNMTYKLDAIDHKNVFYTSPYKINVNHHDIRLQNIKDINDNKKVGAAIDISKPSTVGQWLGNGGFESLHKLVGGKLARDSDAVKRQFDKSNTVTLGEFAGLIADAKKNAFKNGLFKKLNNDGYLDFFLEKTKVLKKNLPEEQYQKIITQASNVINGRSNPVAMDSAVLKIGEMQRPVSRGKQQAFNSQQDMENLLKEKGMSANNAEKLSRAIEQKLGGDFKRMTEKVFDTRKQNSKDIER